MIINVFPARAGMSRTPASSAFSAVCVPRASGDEPEGAGRVTDFLKCSPRERG